MTRVDPSPVATGMAAGWQDPARPAAERVEALLALMSLEQKVAQLGSRWVGGDVVGGPPSDGEQDTPRQEPEAEADVELAVEVEVVAEPIVAPMQDVFSAGNRSTLAEASRHGLGHLTRVYGSRPVSPVDGATELIRQHREVLDGLQLPIPALVHEECLTGFTAFGATVYPAAIAWGATFDPSLVERMAAAIGSDMARLGVHQGLSPVLDVVRDYRWGRVEETIGEDPYLVAMLGSAYVRGLQGSGVIATLKHFAGYSASRAARNHGPVSMGRRELLDVILPTFETAVAEGGAGSVMNSYADVDGVPAGADPWLLTEILREHWGFTGTVVSDYWAVPFLASMHRVAADDAAAGRIALTAGIDVELPDTVGYGPSLVEAVRRGDLDEALIDRAVRRLLLQKAELGLLDAGWTPEAGVADAATVDLDSPDNRALAREIAEKSVVLLDAGTTLPLGGAGGGPARIAVVGPCADDPHTFLGCYSFPNHVLTRHPEYGDDLGVAIPTALDALRDEFAGATIAYEQGCAVTGADRTGIAAAVEAARDADVCVTFVGDLAGLFGYGTSGEGCDVEDLALPGVQADLLEALLGQPTPVVIVVVSGRPYALGEFAGRAAALVQAFLPGEEGGPALAGVLSGRVNPSGHLPVQIPRHRGGQPATYLQPPLGGVESADISSLDPAPLFPFGHGRSYTSFAVSDLRVGAAQIDTAGSVDVTVRVENTGGRDGEQIVQLYLNDPVAEVARPTRMLLGFRRVGLAAGEACDVTFDVHADRVAYTGRDLVRFVEPGRIDLLVGTSVAELPVSATVELTGPPRPVGHDRRLSTPTRVSPAVTDSPTGPDTVRHAHE